MSRWIDAEPLMDKAKEYGGYYEDTVYAVPLADISESPSIDLVRCKECKHYMKHKHEEGDGFCLVRDGYSLSVYANGFCSYGERKESE